MKPMVRCDPDPAARSPRLFIATAMQAGMTRADAKEHYDEVMHNAEWWGNDVYSCLVFRCGEHSKRHGFGAEFTMAHISLHRRDRAPCNDWRELQQIKSDVLGEDAEAVQLYPAEDRVVDTSNEYHLWALFTEDGKPVPWPLGMVTGLRMDEPRIPNAVQRPFENEPNGAQP